MVSLLLGGHSVLVNFNEAVGKLLEEWNSRSKNN
jgi:hypothetical protein